MALQPAVAATDRMTRTPRGEETAAAVGLKAGPASRRTDAPGAGRPGSAWRRSGPRAKWSTKTANEPSRPAYPQRGGIRASCSCPSATNTCPWASVTDAGPSRTAWPPAWATTATLASGLGRVMASRLVPAAAAGNQRVAPLVVISPIWVPAAASCRASESGTSSRVTPSGSAKYQVACWCAVTSRRPVPAGRGTPRIPRPRWPGRPSGVRRTEVSSWSRTPVRTARGSSTSCPSPLARWDPVAEA